MGAIQKDSMEILLEEENLPGGVPDFLMIQSKSFRGRVRRIRKRSK
jgi:hypothetical protein